MIVPEVVYISYNTGTYALPDIYTLALGHCAPSGVVSIYAPPMGTHVRMTPKGTHRPKASVYLYIYHNLYIHVLIYIPYIYINLYIYHFDTLDQRKMRADKSRIAHLSVHALGHRAYMRAFRRRAYISGNALLPVL